MAFLDPRRVAHWMRASDNSAARRARRVYRRVAAYRAARRHGSVAAALDNIVAETNAATVGTARPPGPEMRQFR